MPLREHYLLNHPQNPTFLRSCPLRKTNMSNLVVCFKEQPAEQHLIDRIHRAWPDVEIINVGQKNVASALMEADYFCGHAKVPVDWEAVVNQKRLRWIQSSAAGMDWCLVPPVVQSSIRLTSASGALADQVAEHTLALILAWMRSLPTFIREHQDSQRIHPSSHQRAHRFDRGAYRFWWSRTAAG